mmetsp:Transcript_86144/g.180187  ORF Transcript_86144/g.180187 Transcript_86144/m.180187 type:complete len:422 (+) Transcript_86144:339-1604(+)
MLAHPMSLPEKGLLEQLRSLRLGVYPLVSDCCCFLLALALVDLIAVGVVVVVVVVVAVAGCLLLLRFPAVVVVVVVEEVGGQPQNGGGPLGVGESPDLQGQPVVRVFVLIGPMRDNVGVFCTPGPIPQVGRGGKVIRISQRDDRLNVCTVGMHRQHVCRGLVVLVVDEDQVEWALVGLLVEVLNEGLDREDVRVAAVKCGDAGHPWDATTPVCALEGGGSDQRGRSRRNLATTPASTQLAGLRPILHVRPVEFDGLDLDLLGRDDRRHGGLWLRDVVAFLTLGPVVSLRFQQGQELHAARELPSLGRFAKLLVEIVGLVRKLGAPGQILCGQVVQFLLQFLLLLEELHACNEMSLVLHVTRRFEAFGGGLGLDVVADGGLGLQQLAALLARSLRSTRRGFRASELLQVGFDVVEHHGRGGG